MTDAQDPCKLQQTPSLVETVTDLHSLPLPPLTQLYHAPPASASQHNVRPFHCATFVSTTFLPKTQSSATSRRFSTRPRLTKRQNDELTRFGACRGSFARPQHFSHDRSAGGDVGCGLPHLNPGIHHLRPAHVQQDHLEAVGAW